jgi:hypothetical protein
MRTNCPVCGIDAKGAGRCPVCGAGMVEVNLRRTALWAAVGMEYLVLVVLLVTR